MLTFWADSLIDHDEEPRELNVRSHDQCDLWGNHQACVEQKVICAHSLPGAQSQHVLHPAKCVATLSTNEACGWRVEGEGPAHPCGRWGRPQGAEVLHLHSE